MVLLFCSKSDRADWWQKELQARAPDLEIRVWPEAGNPEDIEYALAWRMPHGELARFPNLKAIFSLGAGVDHLFADPDLPTDVHITRCVDPHLTERMTEYVVLHVLRYHRRQPEYEAAQKRGEWTHFYTPLASERSVGIMGLGVLGSGAAEKLVNIGFDVAGWSRSSKDIEGVRSFFGDEELDAFLAQTEILVSLLPLTPETTDILNASLFARLPEGACVINAARGLQLVDEDLLAALDSGHLAGATLDVFRDEPLPASHPYWTHPKVTITPHVASITDPRSVADQVTDNIRRIEAGEPPLNPVDPDRGY